MKNIGGEKRPRGRPRAFDRDAALWKAMMLFWERGYEGTSVADLTETLGIAPASLYGTFGSKEALYQEALKVYASRPGVSFAELVANAANAFAATRRVLRARAIAFADRSTPLGCMVSATGIGCAPENRGVAALPAERRRKGLDALIGLFQEAIQSGELPPETDTTALARFYLGVIQGMAVQAHDGATEPELLAVVETAMTAWPGRSTAANGG